MILTINLSASATQELTPPDFRVYEKFATTPAHENKIIVGVDGRKIQAATKGPSEPKVSSYIAENGLEMDLSDEKKSAIVDHFKAALRLKYGEAAESFFSLSEEAEALAYGLNHHIVKNVTKKTEPYNQLYHFFEQVQNCRDSLSIALDHYNQLQLPHSNASPAMKGEAALKLAKLMIRNQALVSNFKTAAAKHPDQAYAQRLLQDPKIKLSEKAPLRTLDTLLQAVEHFTEAADQTINQFNSSTSTTKKQAIADGYLQQAKDTLATALNLVLEDPNKFETLASRYKKVLNNILALHRDVKQMSSSPFLSSHKPITVKKLQDLLKSIANKIADQREQEALAIQQAHLAQAQKEMSKRKNNSTQEFEYSG